MYIWRKHATANWLRLRSDNFDERFGPALAIVERPGTARTLLEVSCSTNKEASSLVRELGGTIEKLRPDWLKQFAERMQAKPLRIGSRLVVCRTLDPTKKDAHQIIIPAETAFGTGEHATTTMCLRLLESVTRRLPPGWTMLDAGTGSGVLALAGRRFGAKRVVAIDLDPLACTTAKRNARRNRIRNIEFINGDVLKQKLGGSFDIIAANLFSEILIETLPAWSRQLAPGGRLIFSGILRSQERAMRRALKQNALEVSEVRRRGKWIAILAE